MQQRSQGRVERVQVLIIGAGQAGMAVAYWLARDNVDFIMVDAHARVGDNWRERWDSLQLFTPARYSSLPGLPFPGDPYHLPRKDEVADYLEWYSQAFDLAVRGGVRVSSLRRIGRFFEVVAGDQMFEAENVVVATGPHQTPRIPAFARDLDPALTQLHTSQYRNPLQLAAGNVLVVGAGNSGAQIAMELAASRDVVLAGPSVGSLPRKLLGRDLYDWLWPTVMRPSGDGIVGRRIRARSLSAADPLIGISEGDVTRAGVERVARMVGVQDGLPLLSNGTAATVQNVVWATGFRHDFQWIDLPIFAGDGAPRHTRGVVPEVPGVFFLGLRWLHRQNSALIGGVGADALHIARSIMSRYGARAA